MDIILTAFSVSIPGNPVLVLEGWLMGMGLCKLTVCIEVKAEVSSPTGSRSGQCVIVIKVNVKDGE